MPDAQPASHRLRAALRQEERVTPLELFFDLVFVLALTRCTALMADDVSWASVGKGLLALGLLWWAWVGYAWLTSVVDPEEGLARLFMFISMAAMLIVSLAIPEAYSGLALTFAIAYGVVRAAHIGLFLVASRDDAEFRRSVTGLMISSLVGVTLLIVGALFEGTTQITIWLLALVLDAGGPLFINPAGWRLVPSHFAERHGLILIIALGESIVAIGIGTGSHVTAGVIVAASIGIALVSAMWWAYFDVVALVATRHLVAKPAGRPQNTMARDSYSYIHFLMVAAVVLVALGLKKTLEHVYDPLKDAAAFALIGGVGLYLLAHVAFRFRNVHTLNKQRLLLGVVLIAIWPFAGELEAITLLAVVAATLWAMIAYEATRFAARRSLVRHAHGDEPPS